MMMHVDPRKTLSEHKAVEHDAAVRAIVASFYAAEGQGEIIAKRHLVAAIIYLEMTGGQAFTLKVLAETMRAVENGPAAERAA